ncbi:uncharacterized protein LOC119393868 isoform X2 [Rhipicephalus sanguineus]|uniref:uncharacterized protein LOC119393868 isoform X2 n=1 Tax=Rhipicephalus sanguineus TaxID=34632 RepID=UPI0020C57E06|nr:uncharacterized protein LOC119393868 isoform X2 [Rhipicephalus sanguineus]
MKEAKFWKAQYRLQCQHNATLKKEVLFLKDTVKEQLNSFKDMLQEMPRTRVDTGVAVASVERQRDMATREMISGCIHDQRTAAPRHEGIGISSSLDLATTDRQGDCLRGGMPAAPVESDSMVEDVGLEVDEAHADGMHDNVAEFAPTADGRFHLCKGVTITSQQASKIFSNKKPTIVVRDCAQAIWGLEALAHRTVSGRSVPGEETKQLTPEKVQVVNECLAYWGKEKKEDVTVASHGLQRILSEKIQDVKKKIKQAKA